MIRQRSWARSWVCWIAVLLLSTACAESDIAETADRPAQDVLADVPLFPFSRPVAIAGTSESLEESYESTVAIDTVASWFRRAILAREWEIVADNRAPDGSITLVGRRVGKPFWVMLSSRPGGGTFYRVIGVTDSVAGAGRR